ncbi:MAG: hypothetical protein QNJ19_13420 [Woeseiaceae bacterium]|nr:hypothetical protein [Woeseiaceae bacterium]
MIRRLITLFAIALTAGCASTQSKIETEFATLEGMTCGNLDAEIILAETRYRIEAIRTAQLAQGCEIKPLPPQKLAKKSKRVEPPHWKLDRAAVGADRARQALDRR